MARGYLGATPARRARVAEAQRLRAEGLTQTQIGERMGLKRGAVSDLLSDPDRVKAQRRRLQYGGRCEGCGQPTDGSRGPGKAPIHCSKCVPSTATWTTELILAAILRYADETGHQPISSDWLYDRPTYAPAVGTVLTYFGSWAAALEAAGFKSRIGAKYRIHDRKGKRMFKVFADNGDGAWREIGEFVGNREQAVNLAMDSLNGAAKPERVMTLHPSACVVNRLAAQEKVVYSLVGDGEADASS